MVAIHVFSVVATAGGYFPMGSAFGAALMAAGTLGQALVAATVSGYSQDMEREADQNGFTLLHHAGYDGHAMPRTFQLLDEKLEFEPIESFYRSHPKLEERRTTTQRLAETMVVPQPRPVSEEGYLANVANAICYNIQADINSRRARTALARAMRLAKWKPDNPAYQVYIADAYSALGAKTPEPSTEELTKRGQSEHRKRYIRLTEGEEQKELLARPDGLKVQQANREQAEKKYMEIIGRDPSLPEAHRGLGFLYEGEGRKDEAAREYRRYLELAPADAMDRLRIERRAKALQEATVMPSVQQP